MTYAEIQQTAQTTATALRPTVQAALEAVGFGVTVKGGDGFGETLVVRETPETTEDQPVATVLIRGTSRGRSWHGQSVVEAIVDTYWYSRTGLKKVTYWAGWDHKAAEFTFDADKVAKVVARVQAIVAAAQAKKQADANAKVWLAKNAAAKVDASAQVVARMAEHGITTSAYRDGTYVNRTSPLDKWSVSVPSEHATDQTPRFTADLRDLTEAQMLAILDIIKPGAPA